MTHQRWNKLMDLDSKEELTKDEMRAGWHYCMTEWDGLLIGPGMTEFKYCKCTPFKEEDLNTTPQ